MLFDMPLRRGTRCRSVPSAANPAAETSGSPRPPPWRGPHVGFEPAPEPVPERIHLRRGSAFSRRSAPRRWFGAVWTPTAPAAAGPWPQPRPRCVTRRPASSPGSVGPRPIQIRMKRVFRHDGHGMTCASARSIGCRRSRGGGRRRAPAHQLRHPSAGKASGPEPDLAFDVPSYKGSHWRCSLTSCPDADTLPSAGRPREPASTRPWVVSLSCTRFPWTPICRRGDRTDEVEHERD